MSIQAVVDRNNVTPEDEIILSITVGGTRQSTDPVLPSMPAFKIVSSGTTSSLRIINGEIDFKKEYTYILLPQNEGTFTVGPISVFASGKEYRTNPVQITVGSRSGATRAGPGIPSNPPSPYSTLPPSVPLPENPPATMPTGRSYWITASVSETNPYVNEQMLYTFRFYTGVNVGTATLTLPEFKDFWSEEVVNEKKYYQSIDGRKFVVSEKVLALFPLSPGELTIDETSLNVEVPDERRASQFDDPFFAFGRVRMRPVVLKSGPVKVHVKELPQAPENFANLVGKFEMKTSLSGSEIKTGESATLTVEISGRGNIKDAVLSKNLVPGPESFKIYDDKPEVKTVRKETGIEGGKVFKRALVPTRAGEVRLPAFSLSYFDPEDESFKNMEAPSLVIKVSASQAEPLNAATAGQTPAIKAERKVDLEDIAGLHADFALSTGGKDARRGIVIFLLFTVPPVLFFATLVFRARSRFKKGNPALYRSRQAFQNFRRRLKQINREGRDEKARMALLLNSIREYAGDRFMTYGGALTVADITEKLGNMGIRHETVKSLGNIMVELEAAHYGASSGRSCMELAREAAGLVRKIDKKL